MHKSIFIRYHKTNLKGVALEIRIQNKILVILNQGSFVPLEAFLVVNYGWVPVAQWVDSGDAAGSLPCTTKSFCLQALVVPRLRSISLDDPRWKTVWIAAAMGKLMLEKTMAKS